MYEEDSLFQEQFYYIDIKKGSFLQKIAFYFHKLIPAYDNGVEDTDAMLALQTLNSGM